MKRIVGILSLIAGSLGSVFAQTKPEPPSYDKLAKVYDYDAKKPLNVNEEAQAATGYSAWHLNFVGNNGKTVPGVFLRPKADGVYPCVLLLHGLTSKKEDMTGSFGTALVKNGFAVLALDAPNHGERKAKETNQANFQMQFLETVQEGIKDWRRGLDYLATRKDVDTKRIGMIGYSMGSMMGSILAAVDSRIKASAFCVGGDPILPMAQGMNNLNVYSIAPSLFVGQIAPRPILFINGTKDTTMPEAASKRLIDAAQKPKEVIWAESGHLLPPADAGKAVTWIEKALSKR